jgi:predicted small secreted protein
MKILLLMTLTGLTLNISACSTMEGMGKDIQKLGKSIETNAAPSKTDEAKPIEQPSGAVVTPVK